MVKTEPTVPRARLLSLGKKMQRMLNRDLTPVMRSLLGVHQNRESEKKPPLAVQLKTRTVTATSADDVSRAIKMLQMAKTVISHRKTSSPKSKYKNSPCVAGAGLFF